MRCKSTRVVTSVRIIHYRVTAAVALVTLAVTMLVATSPVAAAPKRVLGCDTWQILPSPNSPNPSLPNSRLLGVSAQSPVTAWAVGLAFVEGDRARTLIEQWVHGAWHIITSPNPDSTFQSTLDSVAVVSPQDVWAVGTNLFVTNATPKTDTLIEHWNGKQWSIIPSPSPSASFNSLIGVVAIQTNDVWAVGAYLDSQQGINLPLAEHWNGHAWQVVPTAPLPSATSGTFISVAVIPGSNQVWAVGNTVKLPRPSFEQALIELWNGHVWQVVQQGSPQGDQASELAGVVALSGRDAWVVGDATPQGSEKREPLVERWDGRAWRVVGSLIPSFADRGVLVSVAATKAHDVRVVGRFFAPETGAGQILFERWDGRKWHLNPAPTPTGAVSTEINALTADRAGNFWAVGDYFTQTSPFRTLTEHSLKCS